MTRKEQWEYAIATLKEFDIEPLDNRMTFSGNGRDIIIHSRRLPNCIQIKSRDTKEDILHQIHKEVAILLNEQDKQLWEHSNTKVDKSILEPFVLHRSEFKNDITYIDFCKRIGIPKNGCNVQCYFTKAVM